MKLNSFIACSVIVCLADFGHFVSADPSNAQIPGSSNTPSPSTPTQDSANPKSSDPGRLHRTWQDGKSIFGSMGKVLAFKSGITDLRDLCDALENSKRRWVSNPDISKNQNKDNSVNQDNGLKSQYLQFITNGKNYLDTAFENLKGDLLKELKDDFGKNTNLVSGELDNIEKTFKDKLKQLEDSGKVYPTSLSTKLNVQIETLNNKVKQLFTKSEAAKNSDSNNENSGSTVGNVFKKFGNNARIVRENLFGQNKKDSSK